MVIYAQYAHRVGVRLQFLRKGYGKSRFDSGILLAEAVGFVRSEATEQRLLRRCANRVSDR